MTVSTINIYVHIYGTKSWLIGNWGNSGSIRVSRWFCRHWQSGSITEITSTSEASISRKRRSSERMAAAVCFSLCSPFFFCFFFFLHLAAFPQNQSREQRRSLDSRVSEAWWELTATVAPEFKVQGFFILKLLVKVMCSSAMKTLNFQNKTQRKAAGENNVSEIKMNKKKRIKKDHKMKRKEKGCDTHRYGSWEVQTVM